MLGTNNFFQEQKNNFSPIATVAASSALGYGAWRLAGKINTGGNLSKYRWLNAGIPNLGGLGVNPTLQTTIWNAVKGFEETFGGFFRTFDVSTYLSSSILQNAKFEVGSDDLRAFKGYYSKLFNIHLSEMDILGGLRFDSGKVFLGDQQVPGYYSLVQRIWDPQVEGRTPMHSRMAQSYQTARGVQSVAYGAADYARGPFPGASNSPFLIVGGKSHLEATLRRTEALGLSLSKRYFRMLDDPVEFIGEMFDSPMLQNFREAFPRGSRFYEKVVKNRLGLGKAAGKEIGGLGRLWTRHAGQLGKYVIVGSFAYHAADNLMADVTGIGLSGIAANIYQAFDMTLSNLSYVTGLTSLRREQERISPGSTSKAALLAFPLSGFVTGGFLAAATNTGKFLARGPEALQQVVQKKELNSLFGKLPYLKGKLFRKSMRWGIAGAGAGAIVSALSSLPLGFGWLGHSKTPAELKAIYEGQEDVAVRKSRWWEMSRSPWEGSTIDYFRPHLTVAIKDRYKEKALYGDGENAIFRALKQTEILKDVFAPYYLEEKFYYDRPYPVAFAQSTSLGPLSPLYNMTFGRLFKPPVIMHQEALAAGGGLREPRVGGVGEVIYESGALLPYGASNNLSQIEGLMQRLTDAIGLPGYMLEMKNQRLTGQKTWFGSQIYLQNSADMNSDQRNFWDMNLGSLFGLTESYRRLQPPQSKDNIYVNNIPNTQPNWMADRFKFGDPYSKIPMGEYRLPGRGYEARYPYLQGVGWEDYPLVNKLQILGDVSPFSIEFKSLREQAESVYSSFSDFEKEMYDKVLFQRDQKMQGREFVEVPNNPFALFFNTAKTISLYNPLEYLLPISPIHKFAGPFEPLTDYKVNMVYAKEYTSWARPINDFIKPALQVASHKLLGLDFIPNEITQQRNIEEYFDRLQYVKYKFLARDAKSAGDYYTASKYERGAAETLTGVNPFGDEGMVYKAASGRERYYIRAFQRIKDEDDQNEVLKYTPQTYHKLYKAAWLERQAAKKRATDTVQNLSLMKQAEGEDINQQLIQQYKAETGNSSLSEYAEWKRMRDTEKFFAENGGLPGPSFAGWHPSVDLKDVKLQMVKDAGLDIHDFDLWESDLVGMSMRPYGELAFEQLTNPDRRNSSTILTQLNQMLHKAGYENVRIQIDSQKGRTGRNNIDFFVEEQVSFDKTYQEKYQ